MFINILFLITIYLFQFFIIFVIIKNLRLNKNIKIDFLRKIIIIINTTLIVVIFCIIFYVLTLSIIFNEIDNLNFFKSIIVEHGNIQSMFIALFIIEILLFITILFFKKKYLFYILNIAIIIWFLNPFERLYFKIKKKENKQNIKEKYENVSKLNSVKKIFLDSSMQYYFQNFEKPNEIKFDSSRIVFYYKNNDSKVYKLYFNKKTKKLFKVDTL